MTERDDGIGAHRTGNLLSGVAFPTERAAGHCQSINVKAAWVASEGELSMRVSQVTTFAVAALIACPLLAFGADKVPDVKGKWLGKSYSIVAGAGGHWPSNKGTFDKPGLFEKDVQINITGQEGRRFWGVTTLSGNGEKTDEPFVGELFGKGNQKVISADTDGYLQGQINGDVFSFCYAQASGKDSSAVVSCTELKRAR